MKKILSLTLFIWLFFSCQDMQEEIVKPEPNNHIIPQIGDQKTEDNGDRILTVDTNQEILPHIPISSDYQVITLLESNIDIDNDDEQIIITQPVMKDADSIAPLEIWIAEFKNSRNEYVLSWKSKLKAELPEGIVIGTKNITGSLTNEILITGFTAENHQTLDIFYTNNTISSLSNIFSISARGSIEIDYQDKISSSLSENRRPAASIHISETEASAETEGFTLIDTVWTLDSNTHSFIKTSQTRKAHNDRQREEMSNIIQGDEDFFLNHLEGFWYHEGGFSDEESLAMLYFNPRENSIIFYVDDEFELYEINYTHKGIYSKIYINSINSKIRNTNRSMTLSLEELDHFTLTVEDNYDKTAIQSPWTGSYKRMGEDLLQNLRSPVTRSINMKESILKGKYKTEDGIEINFETQPLFTYRQGNKEMEGNFSIIKKDEQLLLELVFLNKRSMVIDRKFYSFQLNEEEDEDYIVRSLILTPGKLTIRGFLPSGERNIGYEQLEVLQ